MGKKNWIEFGNQEKDLQKQLKLKLLVKDQK